MPPSFGGTSRCVSTRKPSASSRPRVESSSRRFWKLPPERTTVRGLVRLRAGRRRPGGDRLVERGGDLRPGPSRARARRSSRYEAGRCRRSATGTARPGGRRRAARARSPPGPRSDTVSRTPSRAATASKRRPMPEESGALTLRLSRTSCHRGHGTGRPPRSRWTAAMRHGSRIAASPPGSGTGSRCASALERGEVAAQQLAAPERPVGPVAGAVEDERERRALLAVLGEAGGRVRVVVLDADELAVLLERPLRREVLGVEVVGDDLGLDAEHREVELEVGRGTRGRPAPSRGRRGGRRGTPRRRARRRTCSSARRPPRRAGRRRDGQRQRGRHVAARAAHGEAGRARPSPRSGGGSAGRARGRRRRSRRAAPRASSSSKAIGSSERLPLVSTSGRPKSAQSRWWSGVYGSMQAEPRRAGRDRRRRPRARAGGAGARSAARASAAALGPRRRDLGERLRRGGHHRERLLLAVLARAQPRDGLLVRRVAGEVVAAESLDGDDRALAGARRPPPRAASTAAARRPGSTSARRGSGGRPDPRTRAGSRRRARSRPSSFGPGRRARIGRS